MTNEQQTQAAWDERYAGQHQMWSGNPNGALVAELAGLTPGRVLDVGCGEGADAVWLARGGWDVTALELSGVAIERAQQHARDAGVEITWVHSGFVDANLPSGTFDLVSALYPVLLKTPTADAERALLDAVAVGGVLLFVHHADVEHSQSPDPQFDHAKLCVAVHGQGAVRRRLGNRGRRAPSAEHPGRRCRCPPRRRPRPSRTPPALTTTAVWEVSFMAVEHGEARVRLIGMMLVRNCASSLQSTLDAMSTYCDAVVVVDDRSEDGTFDIARAHHVVRDVVVDAGAERPECRLGDTRRHVAEHAVPARRRPEPGLADRVDDDEFVDGSESLPRGRARRAGLPRSARCRFPRDSRPGMTSTIREWSHSWAARRA